MSCMDERNMSITLHNEWNNWHKCTSGYRLNNSVLNIRDEINESLARFIVTMKELVIVLWFFDLTRNMKSMLHL